MHRVAAITTSLLAVLLGDAKQAPASDEPPVVSEIAATTVFSRLTDNYTEVQREAWFNGNAKDQRVSWQIRVREVKKGWWNFDIFGLVGKDREVVCKVDITPENERLVADITKGRKVRCVGEIKSYIRFVGTTVFIDDAKIN